MSLTEKGTESVSSSLAFRHTIRNKVATQGRCSNLGVHGGNSKILTKMDFNKRSEYCNIKVLWCLFLNNRYIKTEDLFQWGVGKELEWVGGQWKGSMNTMTFFTGRFFYIRNATFVQITFPE